MSACLAEPACFSEPSPESPLPELHRLEDAGVPTSLVEQILIRVLYAHGELSVNDLSGVLGLRFSLISDLIQALKVQNVLQVKRSTGMGEISAILALTDNGKQRARDCLEISHYAGPVPVPLKQYTEVVRRQRRVEGWLTGDKLKAAYHHMIISPEVLDRIGPAVNSGRSFLIYGKPGNGKTYMAEALGNLDDTPIWIPYAIEYQGSVVQVLDLALHAVVETCSTSGAVAADWSGDHRWVRCRRPFLTSGGELTLEMLDLSYNEVTRVYEAPVQLKANNGIYLIDDFGRQKVSPVEVLNRWIIPLERRIDYLTLRVGGKLTAPFEAFLVFSTNLNPNQLGDEAFLRRIQYKLLVRNPDWSEFIGIFRQACVANGLECPASTVERFIETHYQSIGRAFRRCHPRDVLSHAVDLIKFERRPLLLDDELLHRAFTSCFVEEEEEAEGA